MRQGKLSFVGAILALGLLTVATAGYQTDCTPVPVEPECTPEGESTMPPYDCCPGLEAVSDCLPGEACPISLKWCVACGDGVCGEHENWLNCPADCEDEPPPRRCAGPELTACAEGFACQTDESYDPSWGQCFATEHYPVCLHVGSYSEGWYWADSGELIDWALCEGALAVCTALGTRSEGWWAEGLNGSGDPTETALIAWDFCGPRCPMATIPADDPLYGRYEGVGFDNDCETDADCFMGGCSGEVCSADPGVVTTCELVAPARGTCGCVDGSCIWNEPWPCLLL